jgi:hypothetical protein
MKIKSLLFILVTLLFVSCAKDEPETTTGTTGGTGNNTAVTPTDIEITVTMDGTTYTALYGAIGTSMQFNSQVWDNGNDSITLTPSTAMTLTALGNDISYASIIMPAAEIDSTEWADNSSNAFAGYFDGDYDIPSPTIGEVFLILNDGSSWSSSTAATAGTWNLTHVTESLTSPAKVRCQGEITIDLTNPATSETHEAQVEFVMRFQEPL